MTIEQISLFLFSILIISVSMLAQVHFSLYRIRKVLVCVIKQNIAMGGSLIEMSRANADLTTRIVTLERLVREGRGWRLQDAQQGQVLDY